MGDINIIIAGGDDIDRPHSPTAMLFAAGGVVIERTSADSRVVVAFGIA